MQVLNTNRGLWGYTGTAADGEPLTIQSTGMGGPSAAIVAEELIGLGARRLVRVGTCGLLEGRRELGDAARGRRGAVRGRDEPGARRRRARRGRRRADRRARARRRAPRRSSPRPTSSTTPTPRARRRWVAAGAVAVEMEAATLFTVARLRGVAAGCVLVVSDLRRRRRASGSATTRSHAAELRLGDAALAAL